MEWDCGDWSGHLYAEIETKWPEQWQAWQADRYGYRGPNCENYPDMITRSTPFLDELRRHDATNIAVVSHGMIGRVMVATLMDYDPVETMAIHQNNDVVYRVTLDDSGAATELAHFKAGIGPIPGVAG